MQIHRFAMPSRLGFANRLGAVLLFFIITVKLSILISLKPVIFELGEIEEGYGAERCRHEFLDIKDSVSYQDVEVDFCPGYWLKAGKRGFFMHHYSSYDSPPVLADTGMRTSIIHQYGLSGRLPGIVLQLTGLQLSPTAFAEFSLLSVVPLAAAVLTVLKHVKQNHLAACNYIYSVCLYIAGIDVLH